MWTNGTYILYGYNRKGGGNVLTIVLTGWNGIDTPVYHCVEVTNYEDLTSINFIPTGGTSPVPTISTYVEA